MPATPDNERRAVGSAQLLNAFASIITGDQPTPDPTGCDVGTRTDLITVWLQGSQTATAGSTYTQADLEKLRDAVDGWHILRRGTGDVYTTTFDVTDLTGGGDMSVFIEWDWFGDRNGPADRGELYIEITNDDGVQNAQYREAAAASNCSFPYQPVFESQSPAAPGLTFTQVSADRPYVSPNIPPDENDETTQVFAIDNGFQFDSWNSQIITLPANLDTSWHTGDGSNFNDADGITRIRNQSGYEMPKPDNVNKWLDCNIWNVSGNSEADEHTQYRPWPATSGRWNSNAACNPYDRIHQYIEFEIQGDVSDFSWVVIMDHLPVDWPSGWPASPRVTPLGFYCNPSAMNWEMVLKFAVAPSTSYEKQWSQKIPFSIVPFAGRHEFSIQYRFGRTGGTTTGFCSAYLDGTYFGEFGGDLGIFSTGTDTGNDGHHWCKVGAYAADYPRRRPGQNVRIHKHTIYDG